MAQTLGILHHPVTELIHSIVLCVPIPMLGITHNDPIFELYRTILGLRHICEKDLRTQRSGEALHHQQVQQKQQETQTHLLTNKSTLKQNNTQVKKLWQQQRIAEIRQHKQDQLNWPLIGGI